MFSYLEKHDFYITRRLPTLPGPCGPSTIGTRELNFCVRHGNRCCLSVIVTGYFAIGYFFWVRHMGLWAHGLMGLGIPLGSLFYHRISRISFLFPLQCYSVLFSVSFSGFTFPFDPKLVTLAFLALSS